VLLHQTARSSEFSCDAEWYAVGAEVAQHGFGTCLHAARDETRMLPSRFRARNERATKRTPENFSLRTPCGQAGGLLVSWSRYAAHCARGYPTTGGRVASASERIETSLWSGTTDQRTEVSIRGSLREQLLDHRTGADMGLVKYRGSGYPYQCQFGVGSGWLDAAAEFAGNSGKSDAAGQRSASSRGPKLAVGTFLLS
jgi:hypothetical protein